MGRLPKSCSQRRDTVTVRPTDRGPGMKYVRQPTLAKKADGREVSGPRKPSIGG